jgi:CheY-like chemotaxis protein
MKDVASVRGKTGKPAAHFAGLRHQLLTPLNHVIGYSEMLLEDTPEMGYNSLHQNLARIRETARELVRTIHEHLGPRAPRPNSKRAQENLVELRWALAAPLHRILQALGAITSENTGVLDEDDVMRIGRAATELLGFVHGQPKSAAKMDAGNHGAYSDAEINGAFGARGRENGGRILVVDDNQGNRELLARLLRRQRHHVTAVASGAEALERLLESPPDLVLLDMLMPKLDGFQVLEKIKADPALRAIPVIVVSALDEGPGVARCLEIGADDYLFKPVDPARLAARVSFSLENKRVRDRERRRMEDLEKAFRLSEARLRLILAADHAGVWEWEPAAGGLDGLLTSVHPEDRDRLRRRMLETLHQPADFHEEIRVMRPDGSIAWVELLGAVESTGRSARMIGVMRDVTRRKKLEDKAEIKRADTKRGRLMRRPHAKSSRPENATSLR